MSSILFSIETFENGEKETKALFASEDSLYKNNSLEQISQIISSFISSDRNVKFVTKYLGRYDVNGTFFYRDSNKPKNTFFVLIRLIDGDVDAVLDVSSEPYRLNDFCELLSSENKEKNRTYKILECPGELKM